MPPRSTTAHRRSIGCETAAEMRGREPLARIASRGTFALDPQDFGYALVEVVNLALRRADIGWSEVGTVEPKEAFAVQSLACIDGWKIDPDIVNTRGGAIAIGHLLGASGALLGTLAEVLRGDKLRWAWPRYELESVRASRWSWRIWPPCERRTDRGRAELDPGPDIDCAAGSRSRGRTAAFRSDRQLTALWRQAWPRTFHDACLHWRGDLLDHGYPLGGCCGRAYYESASVRRAAETRRARQSCDRHSLS